MLNQVKVREEYCSTCGLKLDDASAVDGEVRYPSEGDATVCGRCGEIYVYNEDLTLRELTEEDEEHLKESDVWSVLKETQSMIRRWWAAIRE